jgi:hypothetical protein
LNQTAYPWLRAADLAGTFVFAVEGAMAGIVVSIAVWQRWNLPRLAQP